MPKLSVFGTEIEVEGEEEAESMDLFPQEEPYEVHEICSSVRMPINTTALESAFLDHCVKHGWITVEHEKGAERHYLTPQGRKELARFGLTRLT